MSGARDFERIQHSGKAGKPAMIALPNPTFPVRSQGRPTKAAKTTYLNENTMELSSWGGLLPLASVC